jgi:hypothetical protein
VKIAVVFDPDPELGPDPLDSAEEVRSIGEFIDSSKFDVLLIWREWGEQFEGGARTHVVGGGTWAHLSRETIENALIYLTNDLGAE